MFSIVLLVSSLICVFGQQTDGGANVIFARPGESSGQNYPNAHLVFVTESNRGVLSSTHVPEFRTVDGESELNQDPMETTRFQCGTSNPCAFQPYTLKGFDRTMGPLHSSVCYCPLGEVCRYHRDNLQNTMLEFRCKATETTTANSTGGV
ncbi:uncharacterized protein TNCT_117891 [Trichonephila clavata]|uniref:Secreted protein n=2 Tax=Trichonephila clavata TaxID=2740835 RepID=A0A8X6K974_TRICU|nr:uncharacterized protein TNCT_117891 [Trichonephila clavata]